MTREQFPGSDMLPEQIKQYERKLVKKCLKDILERLNRNFLPIPGDDLTDDLDPSSGWHACAQAKYGLFTYRLALKSIDARNLNAYKGGLVDLRKSISTLEDPSQLENIPRRAPISRAIRSSCNAHACGYCKQDFGGEMFRIVHNYGVKLGDVCFSCLRTTGELTFVEGECEKHE